MLHKEMYNILHKHKESGETDCQCGGHLSPKEFALCAAESTCRLDCQRQGWWWWWWWWWTWWWWWRWWWRCWCQRQRWLFNTTLKLYEWHSHLILSGLLVVIASAGIASASPTRTLPFPLSLRRSQRTRIKRSIWINKYPINACSP